jgi:AraC-like DNA-binding protein
MHDLNIMSFLIFLVKVKIYIPHPSLQEFVFNISTVDAILPAGITEVVTPYPPTPFQSLIFYCNNPVSMGRVDKGVFTRQPVSVLIGPQYSRVNVKVHERLSAIRVDFLPGGMFRMLGVPMHELFDEGFDAPGLFGADMKVIDDQLQNTASLEAGKNIVENYLLQRVKSLREILPVDHAFRMLLNHHGSVEIEKVAALSCLSLKQFERKCRERLGMNPKLFARILRFSKAYRLHEALPGLSWTKVAHESGYYDQMHMIRDFKIFAGVSPSVIEQQLLATPLRMQKDLRY